MDLSNLKTGPGGRKQRKRVGRGPSSGLGKTAGKGHKGQKARSGYARRAGFEGGQMPLNRRLPKRGFHHEKRHTLAIVNLSRLERVFEDGAAVNFETLAQAGLVKPAQGGVKILGQGDLSKKFTVTAQAVSAAARAKIEAAGGTVAVVAVSGTTTEGPEGH